MNKEILINKLNGNYNLFTDYINALSDKEFTSSYNDKWTAGQQLEHILKSVAPVAKALSAKSFLEENFGTVDRPGIAYDDLVKNYQAALAQGGKAPARFIPEKVALNQKNTLIDSVLAIVAKLVELLSNYTDEELDSLVIPHPLLGKLTVREMIYFTIYHVEHHLENMKRFKHNY